MDFCDICGYSHPLYFNERTGLALCEACDIDNPPDGPTRDTRPVASGAWRGVASGASSEGQSAAGSSPFEDWFTKEDF